MAVGQGATRSWKPGAESAQGGIPLAADASPARLFFADHLKVVLTILVVLHHLSLVYAANSPFYYLEPAYNALQGGGTAASNLLEVGVILGSTAILLALSTWFLRRQAAVVATV